MTKHENVEIGLMPVDFNKVMDNTNVVIADVETINGKIRAVEYHTNCPACNEKFKEALDWTMSKYGEAISRLPSD